MAADDARAEVHQLGHQSNGQKDTTLNTTPNAKSRPRKPPKPNYAKIHSRSLPLDTFPLPAFIPQNPLSLLRIAYAIVQEFWSKQSSFTDKAYLGIYSAESRSVHITDPAHARALWESGFFGKGTLSRSEPSWLDRERAKRLLGPGGTSEEATSKRREERRLFKLERARAERDLIEQQLRQERSTSSKSEVALVPTTSAEAIDPDEGLDHVFPWLKSEKTPEIAEETFQSNVHLPGPEAPPTDSLNRATKLEGKLLRLDDDLNKDLERDEEPLDVNQEHLQLMPEEAFFLAYGLGVLQVYQNNSQPEKDQRLGNIQLFNLFQQQAAYPACSDPSSLQPDNAFLTHYAVYHHYRSLGWVVRPGSKFSVDFLLYNRGPVFSHAEFAIMIIPDYPEDAARTNKNKDWWWLHCVNRVQSQVRKTLVLCYVQIPRRLDRGLDGYDDIGAVLRQYKIRDFVVRRWVANRSRD